MNSSSSVRISKPGPNFTLPGLFSSVAGELKLALTEGLGGNDWPGARAPPVPDRAPGSPPAVPPEDPAPPSAPEVTELVVFPVALASADL